ncbi:hemolysin family protein [Pseudoroseomonas ludipueritiae]|uniref:HlyC/CorC family transporter n=1 Tax=Pseudoroseomonas ludipueritiae TaxID=198093 RepID=A0ABR7R579_9PROT|nr:hemolysin family protein [Pseudoroseomonas ludipueritiae]MBC9176898.1 HlyC/CorC family transporter [Pseudoroseomonas ludipueritiae]MCG7362006.1 hemolysin family protein [Roseomonas sp. ACRSG]
MSLLLELGIILLLVLLNGTFAMSELAIVSSRRGRLLALQRSGKPGAAAALALAEDPSRFLPTVQVGITLVGIFAGAFAGQGLANRLAEVLVLIPGLAAYAPQVSLFIVVLLITYLSLILGELVPKQFALRNPEGVACLVARPMTALSRVAAPMVWLLSHSSALVLKLLGASAPVESSVTEEEVKAVVAEGAQAGALETEERHMIERVLRLADKPVRALMTPRNEVDWIDRDATPAEIVSRLKASEVTRFVVAEGRIDNVVGVVHAKNLLDQMLEEGGTLSVAAAMQQAMVLPDSLSALDALERLRQDRVGLALVMDEYGSFEGVVTASDALEAIVGELGGEPQPTTAGGAVQRQDGSLLLDGMMASDEARDRLDLPELPGKGGYHTVAGLMLALLQRVPREGDRIVWAGWRFEIVDMDGRRIDKVLAHREEATGA